PHRGTAGLLRATTTTTTGLTRTLRLQELINLFLAVARTHERSPPTGRASDLGEGLTGLGVKVLDVRPCHAEFRWRCLHRLLNPPLEEALKVTRRGDTCVLEPSQHHPRAALQVGLMTTTVDVGGPRSTACRDDALTDHTPTGRRRWRGRLSSRLSGGHLGFRYADPFGATTSGVAR